MKYFLNLILLINLTTFSQTMQISGRIVGSKTNEPLSGANIIIKNSGIGVSTLANGEFKLNNLVSQNDSLIISFIGYSKKSILIKDFIAGNHIIELTRSGVLLNDCIVEDAFAKEGITPISFSKLKRSDIESNYNVQDVPEYLSYLPSTTFYSDNGNGIGYNYLNIRGFGQRRISVSVNGIPQNDPEDHNIYWHNMTDLLESTGLLQVQRGAGSGITGYPSIGGSINIVTSPFSDKPIYQLSSVVGSYNTRKYSAKFSSGLIDNKYSVYAKLSKTLSDGYKDNSWVDFNSYHVSAVRYDKNITTQINLFGGPVSDGLAYYGMKKSFIKDKKLRKSNRLTKNEIENFSQPHYELLNEFRFSDNIKLNTALFVVHGDGFFDYDGSWSIYYDDYFRLKENGYDETKTPQNALIRAEVSNKQWGFIPRLTWKHTDGTLITGIEYRHHRSKHWGNIKYAENIPASVPIDYQYYYYEGGNDIINYFVNENYSVTDKLNIMAEVQFAYHEYKLSKEKYVGNNFKVDDLFVNPKFGINYKFNSKLSSYISGAIVTREPRLKNYYDAAESSGGAIPQFEQDSSGIFLFDKPIINNEKMYDIEIGTRYYDNIVSLNVNFYYMLFNDEIVKKGQLDRFGQPITGNIDESIHSGIEVNGIVKSSKYFDLIFNGTYSKNYISKGSTFIKHKNSNDEKVVSELNLVDNTIAGFPELTMNLILRAHYKGLSFQVSNKYVGEYYSDNYDNNLTLYIKSYNEFVDYNDNLVDAYFITNIFASYDIEINNVFNNIKIFAKINNLFNKLYASHAEGGDFFPAAERNLLFGLKLGL